ncbi:hypothetical protein BJ741DRAFT_655630 [Chytriomyces cf. hyalinus JEL632]|nr:hypothetical protein BJ741DRAFT_655630 [Chytriomyces cf. hyalinus JEL632]
MAFRSFLNNACNTTGNVNHACFDEMCPYNQNSVDQFSYGPDYFGQAGYRQGFTEPWMPNEQRSFARPQGLSRFRFQLANEFLDNDMDYRVGMGRPDMNANRFFEHPSGGLFQKPWMNALVANQRNLSGSPMSGFMDEMHGGRMYSDMPARMRMMGPGMMGPGMMGPGMMGPGMMGPGMMGPGMMGPGMMGSGMMGAGMAGGMMGPGMMGAAMFGEMGDMGNMNFMRKRQESGGWY